MSTKFDHAAALRGLVLALSCASMALACDRGKADSGGEAEAQKAEPKAEAAKTTDDEAGAASGATEHIFDPSDDSIEKQACEFLTAEMVAAQFGVPAEELRQTKIGGCIYTWKNDTEAVEAMVMTIHLHDTPEAAKTWFANTTATKTKEELEAQLDEVKAEVQEHEQIDTELKKKTAGELTDLAKLGISDEGASYADVPKLADEARVSNTDGGLWVRMGNLTFKIFAYRGPRKPKVDFDPKNLDGLAEASLELQNKWIADTIEQRKAGAIGLAPVVIEAISSR